MGKVKYRKHKSGAGSKTEKNHPLFLNSHSKSKEKMESTSDDIHVPRDLNSIKNESGRIGSATNEFSEFSDIMEYSARLLYDGRILRIIINLLMARKCLAPAVAEKLISKCEKIEGANAFSACLRDLSCALQFTAKPSTRNSSDRHLEQYNMLRNRIKPLEKSNRKENELMMPIQDSEKIPPRSMRQRRLAIFPMDLSAEEKLAWACQKNLRNRSVDKGRDGLHLTKQNRRARTRALAKKMAGAFGSMSSLVDALPAVEKEIKNKSVKGNLG